MCWVRVLGRVLLFARLGFGSGESLGSGGARVKRIGEKRRGLKRRRPAVEEGEVVASGEKQWRRLVVSAADGAAEWVRRGETGSARRGVAGSGLGSGLCAVRVRSERERDGDVDGLHGLEEEIY